MASYHVSWRERQTSHSKSAWIVPRLWMSPCPSSTTRWRCANGARAAATSTKALL